MVKTYVCMYVCMYYVLCIMDGWMHGWMDGWMDGCMDGCKYLCLISEKSSTLFYGNLMSKYLLNQVIFPAIQKTQQKFFRILFCKNEPFSSFCE